MNIYKSDGTSLLEKEYHPKKRIFLAGPTLRYANKQLLGGWRARAVQLFNLKGFEGDIFIPEPFDGDYISQIKWEEKHLELASCILFWVPRSLPTLPGFTTNIEFGEWMKSKKIVLGYPKDAEKMRYLKYKADKYNVPVFNFLEETIDYVVSL